MRDAPCGALSRNKLWEKDVAGLQTDFGYDGLYRVTAKLLPEYMPSGAVRARVDAYHEDLKQE